MRHADKAAAELEEIQEEIAGYHAQATEPQDLEILNGTVFMQMLRLRQQLARLKIEIFRGLVDNPPGT